jgi:hypothetical protein
MALTFSKPRSVPLPGSATGRFVEPSVGTINSFIQKLNEFPKLKEDMVDARYFSGLRTLICLFDGDQPFIVQLIIELHVSNPAAWPNTYLPTDSLSQILDAISVPELQRLVDHFLNNITVSQMEEMTTLIQNHIWFSKAPAEKN